MTDTTDIDKEVHQVLLINPSSNNNENPSDSSSFVYPADGLALLQLKFYKNR